MTSVGRRVRALDWDEKTSGTAVYAGDVYPEGMLYAKILRSTTASARIEHVDLSGALTSPGVCAVVDSRDLPPGARYLHSGGTFSDRTPFAVGEIRFHGQEIAAVAATTPEAAEKALRQIVVRYRRRPAALTVAAALAKSAPRIHRRSTGSNVAVESAGVWGDQGLGRGNSAHRAGGVFVYPRVSHACMEPNTTLAWWHDDRLELWTSTQAAHFVIHELAQLLELRPDQIVCRDVAVGGSFGSKSKVSEHEVIAALLSMRTGAPVMLEFTRAEELASTKPRHGFRSAMTVHADIDGRICLLEADIDIDNGAYNHYGPSVMSAGIKVLGSMYRPDAAIWRARLVDTNLTPGGQFRGYGQPQTALAVESLVDELAQKCEIDPIEFRRLNAGLPNSRALAGARIGSTRLIDCLDAVRDGIGWAEKKSAKVPYRGVGVAAGMHGSGSYAYPGGNVSAAAVEATENGRITVKFGGSDAGTGQRTILGQLAADILDVPLDLVDVVMTDWDEAPPEMGAWSSRGTHMGGHAVLKAAKALRDRLEELGRTGSGNFADLIGQAPESTAGVLRVEAEYLEEKMEPYWTGLDRPNISASYTFAAHAVEVEIDPDTGELKILGYVAAHDVGRAINPSLVDGQIIGGVVQGLGAVVGEHLIYEGGRTVNTSYLNYPVPRSTTAPGVRSILIEGPEPAGPFDAKSVAEMAIVPVAPAVLNAVYDAIGIRFRSLPLTPDIVLAALRDNGAVAVPATRSFHLARRPSRWQIEAFRRLYPLGLHHLLHRFGTRWARRPETREVEVVASPTLVDEAVAMLADEPTGDAVLVGGATDVLVQQQQLLLTPRVLIRTANVTAMRRMVHGVDGTVTIGGAVTLTELADWARGPVPVIAEAVDSIASAQIRGVATVGGNLAQAKRCWYFRNGFDCYKRGGVTCPCYAIDGDHRFHHAALGGHRCQAVTPSDLATVFSGLDARVKVAGPGRSRTIGIGELYSGPGELRLRPDEMIESVTVPGQAEARSVYEKIRLYDGDFAMLSLILSAQIGDGGQWSRPRLCFGALAPTPWHPIAVESAFRDLRPTEGELVAAVDSELARRAHPLPGNEWKIQAAIGLTRKAYRRWGEGR